MPNRGQITLSDDHVACVASAEGPLFDPRWRMLEDADLDLLADHLTQGRQRPIPIFAYARSSGIPVSLSSRIAAPRRSDGIADFQSRLTISAARPTVRD